MNFKLWFYKTTSPRPILTLKTIVSIKNICRLFQCYSVESNSDDETQMCNRHCTVRLWGLIDNQRQAQRWNWHCSVKLICRCHSHCRIKHRDFMYTLESNPKVSLALGGQTQKCHLLWVNSGNHGHCGVKLSGLIWCSRHNPRGVTDNCGDNSEIHLNRVN